MTHLIINPGSHVGGSDTAEGWTNTFATARKHAEAWLAKMRTNGIGDVELARCDEQEDEGRWRFTFRHTVTGVEVHLDTHGIDDEAAYRRQHVFTPRVYWRGSSSADPDLADFAADGFVMTFRREVDR